MNAIPEDGESLGFRRGERKDEEWLFQLFRQTMQQHIDAAWGWEELLQREGFVTSLPARGFQILHSPALSIGSYHLSDKAQILLLDMILVQPEHQGLGYGKLMMEHIKTYARSQDKAVHLRVLKTNPAVSFHEHCGFVIHNRDQHSLEMCWAP